MPTVSARSLSPRLCKLDSKDNIAQENGLISEEEMVASVEYLVLGHFKREERDEYGVRTMAWLSPADFDSSSTVSKQEVDAKLDEWETLSARVRKEARRLFSVRAQLRGDDRCEIGLRCAIPGIPGIQESQDSGHTW